MNRIIVLSAAFAGLVGGVMSYDAIQSPLFENIKVGLKSIVLR